MEGQTRTLFELPEPARRAAPDAFAVLLALTVLSLLLFTARDDLAGAPFLLSIAVWLVARTRGPRVAAIAAGLFAVVAWTSWDGADWLRCLNLTVLLSLAIVAGSERPSAAQGEQPPRARRAPGLTDREVDVLRLLAHGHTNKAVAAQLGLSVRTIEGHRARIVSKLGCAGRADLYRHAHALGLLDEA